MTIDIQHERGWRGAFTRNQEPGAITNGTPVVKISTEGTDAHPVGAKGKVLGSMSHPEVMNGALCYFVEWEDAPFVAVAVMGWKIAEDA